MTSVNRKNSANSTQSDSKLFTKSKVTKIGNSQKIGPSEPSIPSPIPPSLSHDLKDEANKKLSAPKDGSDRTINRNLPLNKTTAPPTYAQPLPFLSTTKLNLPRKKKSFDNFSSKNGSIFSRLSRDRDGTRALLPKVSLLWVYFSTSSTLPFFFSLTFFLKTFNTLFCNKLLSLPSSCLLWIFKNVSVLLYVKNFMQIFSRRKNYKILPIFIAHFAGVLKYLF